MYTVHIYYIIFKSYVVTYSSRCLYMIQAYYVVSEKICHYYVAY